MGFGRENIYELAHLLSSVWSGSIEVAFCKMSLRQQARKQTRPWLHGCACVVFKGALIGVKEKPKEDTILGLDSNHSFQPSFFS